MGIIMPERNAFDFTERPESKIIDPSSSKSKDQSGKQKL
jgi:hypothetical protein